MNFDRDGAVSISKLEGCWTRGHLYEWDIFARFLAALPAGARALDVGCGSLLEVDHLVRRGLRVTGIDLDAERLQEARRRYDWSGHLEPDLRPVPLASLVAEEGGFELVTVFDVIEHVEDFSATAGKLRELLAPGGVLFISVPNALSASEIYGAALLRAMRIAGREPREGVPHLQLHTPSGWRRAFEAAGLRVLDWRLEIGPLVNAWALLSVVPVQVGLLALEAVRVLRPEQRHRLYRRVLRQDEPSAWIDALAVCDEGLRGISSELFTWNLGVLTPA